MGGKTNWLEDIFVSCLNKKKKSTNASKGKTLLTGVTVMVGFGWRQTLLSSLLPIYLLSSFIGWKHIHFWVISFFQKQCSLWAHLLLLLQRHYQSVPITESDGQSLVGNDLEKKIKNHFGESAVITHVWGFWRHKWWQTDELTQWEDKKEEKQQIVRSVTSSACRWPWCKIFGHEVSFYFQHYSY